MPTDQLEWFERWSKLRTAARMRLGQAETKETQVKDPASKLAVQYAQHTLKDIIRIMDLLEEK
jgi:hypothetical protein